MKVALWEIEKEHQKEMMRDETWEIQMVVWWEIKKVEYLVVMLVGEMVAWTAKHWVVQKVETMVPT